MLPLMAARIGLFEATVADGCWNDDVPLPSKDCKAAGVETNEGAFGANDGGKAAGGDANAGLPGAAPFAGTTGAVPRSPGPEGAGAGPVGGGVPPPVGVGFDVGGGVPPPVGGEMIIGPRPGSVLGGGAFPMFWVPVGAGVVGFFLD